MNKALFLRKCFNNDEYQKNIKHLQDCGQLLKYRIVGTVKLSGNNYKDFTNNFYKDNSFIKVFKDMLIIDDNNIVNCLLFTFDEQEGYLVYSSGYNYARYVAHWKSEQQKND